MRFSFSNDPTFRSPLFSSPLLKLFLLNFDLRAGAPDAWSPQVAVSRGVSGDF